MVSVDPLRWRSGSVGGSAGLFGVVFPFPLVDTAGLEGAVLVRVDIVEAVDLREDAETDGVALRATGFLDTVSGVVERTEAEDGGLLVAVGDGAFSVVGEAFAEAIGRFIFTESVDVLEPTEDLRAWVSMDLGGGVDNVDNPPDVFAVLALVVDTLDAVETVRLLAVELEPSPSDLAVLNVVDASLVFDICELGLDDEALRGGFKVELVA